MYQGIVVVRLFLVRPREIRRAFAPQRPIVRAPIRRRGGGGARRRPRARARREGARREDADGVAHRRARRRSHGRHRTRAVYRTRKARGGVRTRHRVAKWRFAFFADGWRGATCLMRDVVREEPGRLGKARETIAINPLSRERAPWWAREATRGSRRRGRRW